MRNLTSNLKAYKHDFAGSCAPGPSGASQFCAQVGFSVGIFQWVPTANGKGIKKSAVIVRIQGYVRDAEKVYAKAREVCARLDSGWVPDKKSMSV
jgi:hypothetical protein